MTESSLARASGEGASDSARIHKASCGHQWSPMQFLLAYIYKNTEIRYCYNCKRVCLGNHDHNHSKQTITQHREEEAENTSSHNTSERRLK